MPRRRALREVAALVVVGVVAAVGRIDVDVAVIGGSMAGPRSPRWRFTFTMSRGLPIIIPAAPET